MGRASAHARVDGSHSVADRVVEGKDMLTDGALDQEFFDRAWHHRERMRASFNAAPSAAANTGAAARIRKDVAQRIANLGTSETSVAVGRTDNELDESMYVGYHAVFDDDAEVLVVNWQAPAAAPFYKASAADPLGLVRKRTFDCHGNKIIGFDDVVFAQLADAIAGLEWGAAYTGESPDAALLADLEKSRTGEMQEIVRTIQAAQHDLISAPLDEVLIIQGGPGTGKTAVALHRVSWLLFNYRDRLAPSDVLVVGPNPTFTRYIRTLLPALGDTSVEQRDIRQLAPSAVSGRVEPSEVSALKGDERMAGLLSRALDGRIGVPAGAEYLDLEVGDHYVRLEVEEVSEVLDRYRGLAGSYAERRQLLRNWLATAAKERLVEDDRNPRAQPMDSIIDRLWPSVTAQSFLRDLLGSRDRLISAAGEEFTAAEAARLQRRAADRLSDEVWSAADLPLLDEADALINGGAKRFDHIVVDEAQDLSPMQLRSVSRRSATGSMTIVGDIAQSTGPWARDSWADVLAHLPSQHPHDLQELRYGYRVPRQIFNRAAELLPIAAPDIIPPIVVRDGPTEPTEHRVPADDLAAKAVEVATSHAGKGRFVGIVCPDRRREETITELRARDIAFSDARTGQLGFSINLVSPTEAKGLEFDSVVVIEPSEIINSAERGHRLLYIALTRTTTYLDVISSTENEVAEQPPTTEEMRRVSMTSPTPTNTSTSINNGEAGRKLSDRVSALLATELAGQIRESAPEQLWASVLNKTAELLGITISPDPDRAG